MKKKSIKKNSSVAKKIILSKLSKNTIEIKINPKIYALSDVYSAAYVFLDKAYIILDGDPKKEITVRIKSKKKANLEKLALDFFNELVNYCDYSKRAKKTKKIREMIVQRALFTNEFADYKK